MSGASLLVSHGTILSVSLAGQGVCVETGAASSRSPGLLPPSGLMPVRRHECSSNFPTQNQTSGVCLPLRDAAGPGSSHIRAPPREGMHREKFHFIYFPFSPFPDLLCYIIQKMVQMGKPLALRQEAGGRGHGTQPLALGRNRPPSLLRHTSTRGGTAGTLLRRRGQPADPGPPGLTLTPLLTRMRHTPKRARDSPSALGLDLRTVSEVSLAALHTFVSQCSFSHIDGADGDPG